MANNNWFLSLLKGTLTPFQSPIAGGRYSPATFISGLSGSRKGTAAFGFAQGGFGNSPSLGTPPPNVGGLPLGTFQNSFGANGSAGGAGQTTPPPYGISQQQNAFLQQFGGLSGKGIPGLQTPNSLTAGTQFQGANGQTANAAGLGTAYSNISTSAGQFSAMTDANWAFSTNPDGSKKYITTPNGTPIAQSLTNLQIQQMAAANGMTYEEQLADLKNSGYTQFGGTFVYNPSGGAAQQNNLAWWQKEGFASEKKANQYYTDKKRAEKKRADAENPKKNGARSKGSYGTTSATSTLGTG